MMPARTIPQPEIPSNGARLVTPAGRALPLVGAALAADAGGGLARVVLEQRFQNPHAEPLAVTYSLPLPADGAVSGFSFRIGDTRVVGEIDRRHAARERYEQALLDGRSAAILEQERSSLFTQEIGNIPPGAEVVIEVVVDQRLRYLDEGAWEWRFPTVVAPRYLGEPGRVPDADRVIQDVAKGPLPARISLTCQIRDALPQGRQPESPSHPIESARVGGETRVELRQGARLDRDVVVRWAVATPQVGLSLLTGRPEATRERAAAAYGLLSIVPPASAFVAEPVERDLIVLLDTSGSMDGEPLDQARRVVSALIETLRDQDQLELIEFSSSSRRWKRAPVAATAGARQEALAWLRALRASGGTEMREGILEALRGLRPGAQRQVVLVTDGMIGFEAQVVGAICDRLPASSRLHTVGVGSAVNRSLTGPAARAGRGVEVVIGIGEDPERAAARLCARTAAPLVVELDLSGAALIELAPARLPDLFAGAPALVSVALRPEGGALKVRGRTARGSWEQRVEVGPIDAGSGSQAVVALFGREAVEDRELELAAGGEKPAIDAAVERLGLEFQIATRLTSWVAVTREATVDPQGALRRERMPHEIPHGVSVEGLGLRPPEAPSMRYGDRASGQVLHSVPASLLDDELVLGGLCDADEDVPTVVAYRDVAPPSPLPPLETSPMEALEPASGSSARSLPAASSRDGAEDSPVEGRKGGGFLGAVRRLFRGKREQAPAQGEGAASVSSAGPRPGRRLRGRIALQKEGSLVIEVSLDGAALEWDPGARVEISLADGWLVEATVDASRSTRPGPLVPGQIARLTLELPAGALGGVPREVVLRRGQAQIIIEL